MSLMLHFSPLMSISFLMGELFYVSHLFDVDKKGRKEAGEMWRF